jgi:hypothetical protein
MDKQRLSRARFIVAIVCLILPVLYVGGDYGLVNPDAPSFCVGPRTAPYRFSPRIAGTLFWPIEQAVRRLRPRAWEDSWAKLARLIEETVEVDSGWEENGQSSAGP